MPSCAICNNFTSLNKEEVNQHIIDTHGDDENPNIEDM